jgi:ribosome biogenesis GTPase / thiamine phosphate phosphatase
MMNDDDTHDSVLRDFGWDAGWSALVPEGEPSPGRVVRTDRAGWQVVMADGAVHAVARKHADVAVTPTTGDWVTVTTDNSQYAVSGVLPRRTEIRRLGDSRASIEQVLAANIDTVLIVIPADAEPSPGRLERFLTLAWSSGASPLVVLTKCDAAENPEAVRAATEAVAVGVNVVAVSAFSPDGLSELAPYLRHGHTAALLGVSGAGKSTLVNALLGREALETSEVRGDGKGRHTTVRRELILLPQGGSLIDTPGLRTVGIVDDDALNTVFGEIEGYAEHCRFSDCAHHSEPGCAVRDAVASGEIDPRRFENYRRLLREAEAVAVRQDARLRSAAKREAKTIEKTLRSMPENYRHH